MADTIISVQVTPDELKKGQLVHILCKITDEYGMPQYFKNVYMQILDSKGIEVWPFSVIDTNSAGFSKMISTSEMKAGMEYLVRVSVSKKLRPIGFDTFKLEKKTFPKALLVPALALIPSVLIAKPDDTVSKKEESDFIEPPKKNIKIEWLMFVTQKDSRVCKYCKANEGKKYRPNNPDLPEIPVHPKCLLPDTRCKTAGGIVSGLRASYEGKVIEITISNGSKITVTPNHNFLTPFGWCPADLLNIGDDVIYDTNFEGKSSHYPHNNGMPPRIDDIIKTLSMSHLMSSRKMPVSSEDLHGDSAFGNGYIDIIYPNRLLGNANQALCLQHFDQFFFINRAFSHLFSTEGSLLEILKTLAFSADSVMSGNRETSSFFSRRLRHTQKHRFASIPLCDSNPVEEMSNTTSAHFKFVTELLNRHSRIIELQKIIKINVRSWSGYVYDLQTVASSYIANGIIISNCRCHFDVISQEDYYDQYYDAKRKYYEGMNEAIHAYILNNVAQSWTK